MTTALARLPEAARHDLREVLEDLREVLEGADNRNLTTAAIVVDTLTEKVAILDRFAGVGDAGRWDTRQVAALGRSWVIRWDHLTLYVGERAEVAYVLRVAREHALARAHLRELVVTTAIGLGLNRRAFLRPAPLGGRRA